MNSNLFLADNAVMCNSTRHILLGRVPLSHLFITQLTEERQNEFSNQFLNCAYPKGFSVSQHLSDDNLFKWCCACLTNNKENLDQNLIRQIILRELSLIKAKPALEFYKQISTITKSSDESKIIKLIQSFFEFLKYFPSIANVFVDEISEYSKSIPFEQIAQAFGVTSFILLKKYGFIDVGITLETRADFEELFQNPQISNDILTFFQNFFVSEYSFPSTSFLFSSPVTSALNTAATTKEHFVEVIRALASSQYRTKNYASCLEIASMTGDLSTWLFLSFVPQDNFYSLLKTITTQTNTIADSFIKRIKNDIVLLDKLKRISGISINPGFFLENSLPWLLRDSLMSSNTTNFDSIFESPLYMISDFDRILDNDFVCTFFALFFAIQMITGSKGIEEGSVIEVFIDNIKNPETRTQLLTDIFSTIFITRQGEYICPLEVAECFCTILLNYSEDFQFIEKIQRGHSKLQTELFVSAGGDMKNCFTSTISRVGAALLRGDFQIAYNIAQTDNKLRELIDIAKEIFDFKAKGIPGFKGSPFASLEVGLSFADEVVSLQNCQVDTLPEEAKKLRENRIQKNGVNVINIYSQLNNQMINNLEQKLSRLSAVTWEVPSINYGKNLLLNGFFEYLDAFLPTLLESDLTVYDALKVNRLKMIEKILLEGKLEEAQKVAKMMHFNIETVIFDNNQIPFESIKKFANNEKSIISACAYRRRNVDLLPENSKIMKNYIDFKTKIKAEKKKLIELSKDELINDIDKYSQEELEEFLVELIKNNFYDSEVYEEVSFKFYDFSDVIWKNCKNGNIRKLIEATNRCVLKQDLIDKFDFLEKFEDPLPIESLYKRFIKYEENDNAKKVLELFDEVKHLGWMLTENLQKILEQKPEEQKSEKEESENDKFTKYSKITDFADFCKEVRIDWKSCDDKPAFCTFLVNQLHRRLHESESVKKVFDGLTKLENILAEISEVKIDVYRSKLREYPEDTNSTGVNTEFDIVWDKLLEEKKNQENTIVKMIYLLLLFMKETIDIRFGKSVYNLSQFESKEFGTNLFKICYECDLFTFMNEIRQVWNIDVDEYQKNTFKQLKDLSLFRESYRFIPKTIDSIDFLENIMRKPYFNKKFYENPIIFTQKVIKKEIDEIDEERELIVETIMNRKCDSALIARYLVSHSEIENCLHKVYIADFINDFLIPCIEYSKIMQMLDVVTKEQAQKVYSFAKENEQLHLKLYVEQNLGMNMEAALTSISLFSMRGFGVQNFAYLDLGQAMLYKEMQSTTDADKKKEIDNLIHSITYQRLFCVFCTERKLYGFSGLNVFDGTASQESIAVLLLKSGSADLGNSFVTFYNLNIRVIGAKLTDALVNETEDTIISVLSKIEEFSIYRQLVSTVLIRMWYTFYLDDIVINVIKKQKDSEFRVLLFLQFDQINLAADAAISNCLKDLYPIIGKKAYLTGNPDITAKLQKLMKAKK